jgi:hypothetical protein
MDERISCDQCVEIVSARLDGEVRPAESRRADAHLIGCVRCRADAERMTRLAGETQVTTAEAVPDLVDRILAALDGSGPVGTPVDGCASGLHVVGVAPCGCSPRCACGCQSGSSCRCGHLAA